MSNDIYLTSEEVAARLQVSAEWVRRQCKAKVIPAVKLGRGYRISEQDLAIFMRKYRTADVPPARPRLKGSRRRVA